MTNRDGGINPSALLRASPPLPRPANSAGEFEDLRDGVVPPGGPGSFRQTRAGELGPQLRVVGAVGPGEENGHVHRGEEVDVVRAVPQPDGAQGAELLLEELHQAVHGHALVVVAHQVEEAPAFAPAQPALLEPGEELLLLLGRALLDEEGLVELAPAGAAGPGGRQAAELADLLVAQAAEAAHLDAP